MPKLTIKQEWEQLDNKRSSICTRTEDYARWTLPYLFPTKGTTDTQELSVAAGSIGARSVNHLANKLVSTLFVPYRPFFRLTLTDEAKKQLMASGIQEAEIDTMLTKAENAAMQSMSIAIHRTQAVLAMKNLIVTGNACLYYPPEGNVEVYNLRDYVVRRSMNGMLIKLITRDSKVYEALPVDIQKKLLKDSHRQYKPDTPVDLFTKIEYNHSRKKYYVTQAVDNYLLPNVNGSYPVGKLPWIVLTWNMVRGEDYGRGLVEDYAYAFHSHQVLTSAQMRLYAIVSDLKLLVDPSSTIDPEELNSAPPGTYIAGRAEDITCPQFGVEFNLAGINEKISSLERELAQAFLLTSAVTRDAERVTAEEIRMQITELETAHGGIYSRLAAEWQTPLVGIVLDRIGIELDQNIVPQVVTGMEAMSRSGDLENMQLFLQDLASTGTIPERFQVYLNEAGLIATLGALRNVQYSKFLKSPEEVAQEQAAAQQQAMQMQQQQMDMQMNANTQVEMAKNM